MNSRRTITCTTAVGSGPTRLGAFHDALRKMGAESFNLVRLSSVIPLGWEVRSSAEELPAISGRYGDRLYCVYADAYAESGETAAAALSWASRPRDGGGHFAEASASTLDEARRLADVTLEYMCAAKERSVRGGLALETTNDGDAASYCVLALASYGTEPWQ